MVMASAVVAYTVMDYIVMAHIVMTYVAMAYVVMACFSTSRMIRAGVTGLLASIGESTGGSECNAGHNYLGHSYVGHDCRRINRWQ